MQIAPVQHHQLACTGRTHGDVTIEVRGRSHGIDSKGGIRFLRQRGSGDKGVWLGDDAEA